MKILASTPKQYNRTSYIVELNSTELLGILCLGSYSKVPVADADGNKGERDKDKLQSGDFIEPEFINSTAEEIRRLRTHEAEISKAFTSLRGSLTKVQNILKPQQ